MGNHKGENPKFLTDSELTARIMSEIGRKKELRTRRKTLFFGAVFVLSIAALPSAFGLLSDNLATSGFMDFLALAFSDREAVAAYWQSFAMSLLEAIPAVSLAIFLCVILVMMQSLKALVSGWQATRVSLKNNHLYGI